MSQSPTKVFAPGNAKINDRATFWLLRYSFPADKMIEFCNANKNERGYVNLNITERRTPDDKSSHTVALDTWQPDPNRQSNYARQGGAGTMRPPIGSVAPKVDPNPPF